MEGRFKMVRGYREDWAEESVPLQKSKEPEGKEIRTIECPKCKARVIMIAGKMSKHPCTKDKK